VEGQAIGGFAGGKDRWTIEIDASCGDRS